MNIQKSRFAVVFSVMLTICVVVCSFAISASAATHTVTAYYGRIYDYVGAAGVYEYFGLDLHGYSSYLEMTETLSEASNFMGCYFSADGRTFYVHEKYLEPLINLYCLKFPGTDLPSMDFSTSYMDDKGNEFILVNNPSDTFEITSDTLILSYHSDNTFADTVTEDMFSYMFNDIIGLVPVCIPAMIGFIGLRKGIAFLRSVLHTA